MFYTHNHYYFVNGLREATAFRQFSFDTGSEENGKLRAALLNVRNNLQRFHYIHFVALTCLLGQQFTSIYHSGIPQHANMTSLTLCCGGASDRSVFQCAHLFTSPLPRFPVGLAVQGGPARSISAMFLIAVVDVSNVF